MADKGDLVDMFFSAAVAGLIAREGLPQSGDLPAMIERCMAFANEAVQDVERRSEEPKYQLFILGRR